MLLGRLVEMNPAAETLYGVPREEFLGKKRSIFDFAHEEDKKKALDEVSANEEKYRIISHTAAGCSQGQSFERPET